MGTGLLRVGVIGCGALGAIHARKFASMPGVEVRALSDPDEAALNRTAESLSVRPLIATDYREILDCGLDAVCIATPDAYHIPQALDALAANLHVLCEKPLTLDPTSVEAIVASRDETGKVFVMTYPRRHDRGLQAMRQEIQSGRWGNVIAASVYSCEDWVTDIAGTWRHDPAICPGGFLYDASGHQLDTLFWMTGLHAEWVDARTSNCGHHVPLLGSGMARLTGGVPMAFTLVGVGHCWREQVNIQCEGMDFTMENGRGFWAQDGRMVPIAAPAQAESGEEAFVRLIREGGMNWAPPDEVWPVVTFTRALLESGSTGRPVNVDPPGM